MTDFQFVKQQIALVMKLVDNGFAIENVFSERGRFPPDRNSALL